ncbi:glycosyltransferase family 4 protein [Caldalkalibacillus mannanilyticus]|uniref:glycosyltransferase family 4 protein n=1 Tax=Caldalkalibacillus mannanilyticus TaxID=1418 RepID=UPI000468018A|nr:glycosyltransferase family 1 protein [Caldalkalibacillus mannanilyticus]
MRIAIFTDTYTPEINGVARTLDKFTTYLTRNRITFQVFAPESSSSIPTLPQIQRFTSLPFFLYPECRITIPNPIQMKLILDQFKPSLIHVATPFNLGLYGTHYGRKLNIPTVASYHTHFDAYLQYYHLLFLQKWIWRYMRWFHQSCKKVYVPSQSTKEKLVEHHIHHDIEIWGRGVDHTFFTPAKRSNRIREKYNIKEKNILLYVGRIAPEKDIDVLFYAFHSLPESLKENSHLLIVGDGPLLQELRERPHPQISFAHFVEGQELAEIYASSDLFLFPSSTETFGNVVLEAMASGLPIIGAQAGGVQHLITHAENGFLCKPKDAQSFVEHTKIVLEYEQLRLVMAAEAREFALSQSWDEIFAKLISSYSQVIEHSTQNLYSA